MVYLAILIVDVIVDQNSVICQCILVVQYINLLGIASLVLYTNSYIYINSCL